MKLFKNNSRNKDLNRKHRSHLQVEGLEERALLSASPYAMHKPMQKEAMIRKMDVRESKSIRVDHRTTHTTNTKSTVVNRQAQQPAWNQTPSRGRDWCGTPVPGRNTPRPTKGQHSGNKGNTYDNQPRTQNNPRYNSGPTRHNPVRSQSQYGQADAGYNRNEQAMYASITLYHNKTEVDVGRNAAGLTSVENETTVGHASVYAGKDGYKATATGAQNTTTFNFDNKHGPDYVTVDTKAGSATAEATANEDTTAIGATAVAAEISTTVGTQDPRSNKDTSARFGVAKGGGAAGRVHHSDEDGDGYREYGFGFDVEFVTVDVKSEDPMRVFLPGTNLVPGDHNVTHETAKAAKKVGDGVKKAGKKAGKAAKKGWKKVKGLF